MKWTKVYELFFIIFKHDLYFTPTHSHIKHLWTSFDRKLIRCSLSCGMVFYECYRHKFIYSDVSFKTIRYLLEDVIFGSWYGYFLHIKYLIYLFRMILYQRSQVDTKGRWVAGQVHDLCFLMHQMGINRWNILFLNGLD